MLVRPLRTRRLVSNVYKRLLLFFERLLQLWLFCLFVCLLTNRNIKTRNTNVNHNKNKYANWWITSVVKTTANSNPLYGENNKILIKRTF